MVCEALLRKPGRRETLEEWCDIAGASSRTLARLFASETGMRFVDWRQQARLGSSPRLWESERLHCHVSQGAWQGAARLLRGRAWLQAGEDELTFAPDPADRLVIDFDAAGRLGLQMIARTGVPCDADFYLCGPAAL